MTLSLRYLAIALGALIAPGVAHAQEKAPAPTHANVKYGPHDRNLLDFWQAKGDGPRPLLVYIHGGGWTSGDKTQPAGPQAAWLAKGVSYAAINYRLTPANPLPAPVHDAARAIQFLRSKSKEWNINPDRICLTGGSAGACTSMWLVCHDELADPKAADPILRESTRVAGAAVFRGQTSIDPKQIEPWLGPQVLQHRMINMAVGELTIDAALKNYEKHRPLYLEFSAYNHVSKDDPPLLMICDDDVTLPSKNAGHGIHHPVYCLKLKEKADSVGMECHVLLGRDAKLSKYPTADAFLEARLLGK
jgi:arylformamidase